MKQRYFTLEEEQKNNRGKNLEFRYQITMMDANGDPLESDWEHTKDEAIACANRIFKNPKNADVDHCMIYNRLNDKLSFRLNRP